MNHPEGQAAPESGTSETATLEELAADPEIAALLEFDPVPVRKKVNGWDAQAQRAFVILLATTGSKLHSADAIGRKVAGMERILKRPDAAGLAAAVESALALAERRNNSEIAQGVADATASRSRRSSLFRFHRSSDQAEEEAADADAPDPDEEQKLQLVEHLAGKLMKKVALERQARLNGEIVAADFTLRQVTMIEILFDLAASHFGWNAGEVLRNLRRGERSPLDIVSTPFADWLDVQRRIWWASEGDPERPPHPDLRFIEEQKEGPWGPRGEEGYTTYVDDNATGALTNPARGYTQDEWRQMDHDEQRIARQVQFDVDSEEQREWERRAHEAWEARQAALSSSSRT